MKNFIFSIALMLVVTMSNAQIIPNASFENWTNFGSYSNPSGWTSMNEVFLGTQACEQGTPGATGNSFLKLTVKDFQGSPLLGLAYLADIDWMTDNMSPNYACNTRPANLAGKYRYLVSPFDSAGIYIELTKWNAVTQSRDIIGSSEIYFGSGAVANWTNFSVPISYTSNAYPDSATIAFGIGVSDIPVLGDYLHIDDISFNGSVPAGLNDIKEDISLNISPNPFDQFTTISFNETQQNATITMFDVLGNRIKTEQFSGKEYRIERGTMQNGLYLMQITDDKNNTVSKKIMVN